MKKILISPSAIGTWRQCQRKWGIRYIDRKKSPPSKKMEFGTAVHKILENWLGKAEPPPIDSPDPWTKDAARVAMQGIKKGLLPTPDPRLLLEYRFDLAIPEVDPRAYFMGYIDFLNPPEELFRTYPEVNDHKTTSDLKWALDWKGLSKDPQGLIYSRYAMEKYGTEECFARWIYYAIAHKKTGRKDPKGSTKTEHLFNRRTAEFQDPWGELLKDASAIVKAKDTWRSANEDAEPNPAACNDYGGCLLRPYCDKPTGSVMASYMRQFELQEKRQRDKTGSAPTPTEGGPPMSSFLEQMKAQAANASAPTPEPKPEPKPAPAGSLLARLKAKADAVGVNPPPATDPEPEDVPPVQPPEEPEAKKGKKPAFPCHGCGKSYKVLAKHKCPALDGKSPVEVQPHSGPTSEDCPACEVAAEDPASEDCPACETPTKPVAQTLMVLIDCVLRKGNTKGEKTTRELSEWISPLAKFVAEQNDVEHWGLIDFAKGAPMLEAKVEKYLEANPIHGVLYMDSGSREGRALKDLLIRHADIVIQATR